MLKAGLVDLSLFQGGGDARSLALLKFPLPFGERLQTVPERRGFAFARLQRGRNVDVHGLGVVVLYAHAETPGSGRGQDSKRDERRQVRRHLPRGRDTRTERGDRGRERMLEGEGRQAPPRVQRESP